MWQIVVLAIYLILCAYGLYMILSYDPEVKEQRRKNKERKFQQRQTRRKLNRKARTRKRLEKLRRK